ncbi:MAG: hypothetical protein PHY14_02030 [Candidatus Gracilibacteria bacterium]|nr:hypothetical protein [Candidatus Gracilibacteria bacterium]
MITVCVYPENLGSPDRPRETADKLIAQLQQSPPLPFDLAFQFKYGREVRDALGGRHPARAYMGEVSNMLRAYIANLTIQFLD